MLDSNGEEEESLVLSLFFADSVEHHRFVHTWLFADVISLDIVEELYETPFILALFFMAFYFMQHDQVEVTESETLPIEAKSGSCS